MSNKVIRTAKSCTGRNIDGVMMRIELGQRVEFTRYTMSDEGGALRGWAAGTVKEIAQVEEWGFSRPQVRLTVTLEGIDAGLDVTVPARWIGSMAA